MRALRWLFFCTAAAACCGCSVPQTRSGLDADAEFRRADALSAAGNHEAAARAYARSAKAFAASGMQIRAGHAQFLCGEEYFAAGKHKAALAAFDTLYREFEGSEYLSEARERSVEIGKKLLATRDPAGVQVLEKVTLQAPFSTAAVEAHLALGQHHLAAGRFAEAQIEFDAAARARPGPEQAARAEFHAAVAEYRQIERPARDMSRLASARERFRQLREQPLTAEAMSQVDAYLKATTDLGAEHHLLMAHFYLKQADTEAALSHLREILERYPESRLYEPAARELIELILKAREEQQQ